MSKKQSYGRIGLCTGTFLLFLILKLTQIGLIANWSWWWVFSPLWGPVALIILGFIIYALILRVIYKYRARKYRKKKEESENIQHIIKSRFQQKLEERLRINKKNYGR